MDSSDECQELDRSKTLWLVEGFLQSQARAFWAEININGLFLNGAYGN
ncbi:hypothetical protein IQ235_04925 [Oscillatoriales cyanobacterium LEGE 11467]|uniref:Uncharacterized protein n=1 Tax=Zarconia navalis LEGE 11467 TaxID=1828826 RepID=A0A928Z8T0_9CYAN|nr:hypothetical protein [Zarconia navalis]MBE9040136.1 hypothetical protein [Zarconia navalis LEGE 11467]